MQTTSTYTDLPSRLVVLVHPTPLLISPWWQMNRTGYRIHSRQFGMKEWLQEGSAKIQSKEHVREPQRRVLSGLYRAAIEREKIDARTVHFPLTIAKDGEGVVRFTVRYTW